MKKMFTVLFIVLSLVACKNNKESNKNETESQQTRQTSVEKEKPKNLNIDQQTYIMKGKLIAKNTFQTFKGKIENIGSKQGLPATVSFCHENAYKIADSIGKIHNVVIKRTSQKLRNPENKPNKDQQAIIDKYLKQQENNEQMKPIVMTDEEGYVHFYAPIKLKKACLQCHGQPGKEIHDEVYKVIKAKYPNDQATGYKEGDLRAIWDIKFLDKK